MFVILSGFNPREASDLIKYGIKTLHRNKIVSPSNPITNKKTIHVIKTLDKMKYRS